MNLNTIDIVYTWVNGNDPDYRNLYNRYSDVPGDVNPERYRDIYSMLRYSLRSVQMYAPWVGDIYLFTCRPQVPEWLNVNHPRIHLVHHDEIIDEQYLPTFSSNVIETYLHDMPGQSDYLLYMNDDWFFYNNVTVEDFLVNNQQIKVYGTLLGEKLGFRVYDGKYDGISLGFLEHLPWLINKSYWQDMLSMRVEELHRTRLNRFRRSDDLRMDKLYKYYLLKYRKKNSCVVPLYQTIKYSTFHKINNNKTTQVRQLGKIRDKKPRFLCMNDDQKQNPDPDIISLVSEFLETSYPHPSDFEL